MCKTPWGTSRLRPKGFIVCKHRGCFSLQALILLYYIFICTAHIYTACGHITEKRSPEAVPADFNLFHIISSWWQDYGNADGRWPNYVRIRGSRVSENCDFCNCGQSLWLCDEKGYTAFSLLKHGGNFTYHLLWHWKYHIFLPLSPSESFNTQRVFLDKHVSD